MASEALPGDYEASAASQVIEYLQSGEGVSARDEEERFFLLGRDMIPHAKVVQDQLGRILEAFGEVARNAYIDQK
ncbi:hypothetical protein N7460_000756 [Penicillium canescens]|uniref:Uncharacterized protein n=1 Tax=Penicillium canescens TaxID=5083 RepID=A0AAD6IP35_PENCN|nr:hypothetical protein N7444_011098 [Penicillium canescens]KAJ6057482.1 hypothetical protein N7460_000756 [Penicillium canescens]